MASSHDSDHPCACAGGLSRRGFLTSVGTSAIGAVATAHLAGAATAEPAPDTIDADAQVVVSLQVNGLQHRVTVEPRWSLLFVLRDRLGLTATKVGCERGECGACTVLIDGQTRYACMTLALEAEGHEIVTLEGLMRGEQLGPVQQAFVEHDAFQCGYCTPGQIMAVEGLLRANPSPTLDEVREGVSGNLCRCGTYAHIFQAAERAAELKRG
jgi:xanthine dehydrogenase YagT iron-sulfur-binding subunit